MGLAVSNKRKMQQSGHRQETRSVRGEELATIDFLMKLGEALHRYGTAADRIEEALTLCARRARIEANILAAPTSLQANFETATRSINRLVRLGDNRTDLEKLVEVDRIMDRWLAGEIGPQRATTDLKALRDRRPRYGAGAWLVSNVLTAIMFSLLIGLDTRAALLSGVLGLVVGLIVQAFGRQASSAVFVNPAAGFAAAAGSDLLVADALDGRAPAMTVAAVLVLLPGNTLTTGLRELATGHLTAGTTRLSAALMALLGLAIGVAAGHRFSNAIPDLNWASDPGSVLAYGEAIALLVLPMCLMVQFHARPRDFLAIAFGSLSAWAGVRYGEGLAPDLGVAAGAFAVGVASNTYARLFDRPSSVMQVPGIILLVPGSIGLRSVLSLLEQDTVIGVESLVSMVTVAAALVFGLLIANFVVAPRKVL